MAHGEAASMTTDSPPVSPTSQTPSFSWPRRVRSPEPYVPLRKASPERLHNRKSVPHPLFVTTNSGSQGYAPATSSKSAASPYESQVNAEPQRNDGGQPFPWAYPSHEFEPQSKITRKVTWPFPMEDSTDDGSSNGLHDENDNYSHHLNQDNPNHYNHNNTTGDNNNSDAQGRQIFYRQTHNPTSQPRHYLPLQNSHSHDALRGGAVVGVGSRARLRNISQETLGSCEASPVQRHVPSLQEQEEEVRTSFRSALTSNSSLMASTTGTERSSICTADSSFSDFVRIERAGTRDSVAADSDFDVDDMLDLYATGFETPNKQSLEIPSRRDSFPRASVDSNRSNLCPHPSPLGSHSTSARNVHRRSKSASFLNLDRLKAEESMNEPLPEPGVSGKLTLDKPAISHSRSSTQIIAGRDLDPIHIPQPAPSVNPISPVSQASSNSPASPEVIPRDRYGFKKVSHYVALDKFDAWERSYNEHLDRRRTKWIALMKQYGYTTDKPTRFPGRSDKVKRYIRKGIPPDWRGAAWFWYAGGPSKLARDPGLYWNLLQQVHQGELSDNDREHIERDLHRTFPDNIRFKPDPSSARDSHADSAKENGQEVPETDMIRALRRVLQAFAVHNPSIGYCQSLNFIAGLLLIFLDADEEKTFVLLNVITSEHLPGTHGVALEGANIDIAVLMASIRENIPSVWQKLDDRQPGNTVGPAASRLPTVSLATTAWFMSLFVGTLPMESVLRVWDCLFFEGSKTLFRVGLAIFKAGEAQIQAVADPMEVFQVVQSMPRSMLDANALMECCFRKRGGFGGLSQDFVEKRRQEGRKDVREGRALTGESGSAMAKRLARAKSRGRFGHRK